MNMKWEEGSEIKVSIDGETPVVSANREGLDGMRSTTMIYAGERVFARPCGSGEVDGKHLLCFRKGYSAGLIHLESS